MKPGSVIEASPRRVAGNALAIAVHRKARELNDGFEIVKGDLVDAKELERAAENCFEVHINLSGKIEQIGVEAIAAAAAKLKLQRITTISGTKVQKEKK